jgi:Methyltransferase domain
MSTVFHPLARTLAQEINALQRQIYVGPSTAYQTGRRSSSLGNRVVIDSFPASLVFAASTRLSGPPRARSRVDEAGLHNITFTHSDLSEYTTEEAYDAAVGRFILEFLPDPVTTMRRLSQLVRPGGVLAFQAPAWAPVLASFTHLPLWSAAASLLCEVSRRSGVNPEAGLALYRIFQDAGLPAPRMRMEIPLGDNPEFINWIYDVLCSLRPQIHKLNVSLHPLGDFATLPKRLHAEVAGSRSFVSWMAVVGAWCRK